MVFLFEMGTLYIVWIRYGRFPYEMINDLRLLFISLLEMTTSENESESHQPVFNGTYFINKLFDIT